MINKKNRVNETKLDIDSIKVADFFRKRSEALKGSTPLTSVLYQDNNPELAIERDNYERQKILPLLSLSGHERVIDIGCGIGRWASHLGDFVPGGIGLDFNPEFIEYARTQFADTNWSFDVLSAQDVSKRTLEKLGLNTEFDLILCAGICIYLNDEMLSKMISGILEVAKPASKIYLREPAARSTRLTLDGFWSDELASEYSAIYRTLDEYNLFFDRLISAGFTSTHHGPMYEDQHLNNRQDTYQNYWIFNRTA